MTACCARVPRAGSVLTSSCSKSATVTVDGKHYCSIHSPHAYEKRRAKASKLYTDRAAAQRAMHERESALRRWHEKCAQLVERLSASSLNDAPYFNVEAASLMARKPK